MTGASHPGSAPRAESGGRPPGTVYLVGAGPGDPGLLTVRGREILERADVVVYDRLGAPELLEAVCRPDAERIFAGKGPRAHTLTQAEINALLIDRARAGRTVVRLKGGDPFVLGRGGEEALALVEAGIPFEVVPGVTSAVAVPAYAGIPLTQRGVARSFLVATGHEAPDPAGAPEAPPVPGSAPGGLDWPALGRAADTLVFLMGLGRLAQIAGGLVAGGRPASTPAAVIRCGTTAEQRTVTGTLADIAARAQAAGLTNPAIVVVGEVVRLRERLAWFETRPLFGRRVLVTRARGQAGALSREIAALGGEPVEVPLIEILPPADPAALDAALAALGRYRWIVFTSANGVEFFFRRLWERGGDARALAAVRIAVVGEATANALAGLGLRPDLVPETFRGEALVAPLAAACAPGDRVLLARGDLAAPDLPAALAARGVAVEEAVAYRTVPAEAGGAEVRRLLSAGRLDAVTFASPSAVENFLAAVGEDAADLLGDTVVACVGPVTAEAARARGLPVHVVPARSTVSDLAAALAAHFHPAPRGPMPRES